MAALRYWAWLERLFARIHGDDLARHLRPGATQQRLSELESRLGVPLPGSLAAMWRQHDGVLGEAGSSIPEIASTASAVTLREELLRQADGIDPPIDARTTIPFATVAGEVLWVDASPERHGEVHAADFEASSATLVAPTLDDWFRRQAAELAAENGYWFVGERLEYRDALELAEIVGEDDEGWDARRLPGRGDARFRLAREGAGGAWAIGDVVRCEVAKQARVGARVTLVASAAERLAALDAALLPWRSAGFELPAVSAAMLRRCEWADADASAELVFAEGAPLVRGPWAPVILRDTLDKLALSLSDWRIPALEIDREALLEEAGQRRGAGDGSANLYDCIAEGIFYRINAGLERAGDGRRFERVLNRRGPLEDVWLLLSGAQGDSLRELVALDLARPGPPASGTITAHRLAPPGEPIGPSAAGTSTTARAACWDRLERLIAGPPARELVRLRPGAPDPHLRDGERRLGLSLPASLAAMWRQHDGTTGEVIEPLTEVLSIASAIGERDRLRSGWKGSTGRFDPASMIPFARPGTDALLCVDAAPGRPGAVHLADMERHRSALVAPSLSGWFRRDAARIAAADGHRFVGERLVYGDALDLAEISRCDAEGCLARFPPVDGDQSCRLVRGITELAGWASAAVGDIVRCEVAKVSRIATRAALVASCAERTAALEEALLPWRRAGFVLPVVDAALLLRCPWDAEAAAEAAFAEHAALVRAAWRPRALPDILDALGPRLAAWHVPALHVDAAALMADAERLRRSEHGTAPIDAYLPEGVFHRVNAGLGRAGDGRRFVRVVNREGTLRDAWLLASRDQEDALRRLVALDLAAPRSAPGR